MSVVLQTHPIIKILYVVCDTFPPGKSLGECRGPSVFLCFTIIIFHSLALSYAKLKPLDSLFLYLALLKRFVSLILHVG